MKEGKGICSVEGHDIDKIGRRIRCRRCGAVCIVFGHRIIWTKNDRSM